MNFDPLIWCKHVLVRDPKGRPSIVTVSCAERTWWVAIPHGVMRIVRTFLSLVTRLGCLVVILVTHVTIDIRHPPVSEPRILVNQMQVHQSIFVFELVVEDVDCLSGYWASTRTAFKKVNKAIVYGR